MEWLRSVDLAEYAPNLRGSGVHGGLMVKLHQLPLGSTFCHGAPGQPHDLLMRHPGWGVAKDPLKLAPNSAPLGTFCVR